MGRGLAGLRCRPPGLLRQQAGVAGRALKRCHRTGTGGPAVGTVSTLHRSARVLGGIGAFYAVDRAIAAGLDAADSSCPSSVVGICCFGMVAANPAVGAALQMALGFVAHTPLRVLSACCCAHANTHSQPHPYSHGHNPQSTPAYTPTLAPPNCVRQPYACSTRTHLLRSPPLAVDSPLPPRSGLRRRG